MGRRLLVERTRELPQIRANQSGSLEMSATWLPPLSFFFFFYTLKLARAQTQTRTKYYNSIQFSAIPSSDLLAFHAQIIPR